MATPRRRLVRPAATVAPTDQQRLRRAQQLRDRRTQDRASLDRWMRRLKRAFHSMEKLQRRIARLDRQITRLEDTLMSRVIEITVSPTGETTVQTKGYAGADCLRASRFLEQALGTPAADTKTAEFYATTPTEQQVRQ